MYKFIHEYMICVDLCIYKTVYAWRNLQTADGFHENLFYFRNTLGDLLVESRSLLKNGFCHLVFCVKMGFQPGTICIRLVK